MAIAGLDIELAELFQFFIADPVLTPGNFFWASDFEALAFFNGGDELAGFKQAVVGAGVKPGVAAAHDFYLEFFAFEVDAVDIGYLEFSACAGFDIFCYFDNVVVVKVEARYCVAGFGFFGLFFDGDGLFVGVEFDDTVALRVGDCVGEDGGPFIVGVGGLQYFAEVVAVKDVVAKDEIKD